jgi:subtilisin family serine protease
VAGTARDRNVSLQAHRLTRANVRADIAINDSSSEGYLYRPGEMLVAASDVRLVAAEVDRWKPLRRESLRALGVVRFSFPDNVDIPSLVSRLRTPLEGRRPRLGPNHVFTGEPAYQGGPADSPNATRAKVTFAPGPGARVRVAVLDTGFFPGIHSYLDERCESTATDVDALNVLPADGFLDSESGHGTFIAGVVLQGAPSVKIDVSKVLDSEGYGDELGIAQAILDLAHASPQADVLNMSFGAYSHGDGAPLALEEALRRIPRDSVVVAAAGNNDSDRLMWPAAFKRVIAAAALDKTGKQKARFSNYGWWVDACTPAVEVLSTFVEFAETGGPEGNRPPQSFHGFATWSGTSFAAPKVAARIAATKTTRGFRTAREAADDLLATAPRLADLGAVV